MVKRIGVKRIGVVGVLVVVSVVMAALPAAAAPHSITVTPSAGLTEGQVIQVTGTGFTETPLVGENWGITQCTAAVLSEPLTLALALGECDASSLPFTYADPDAAGNLSASFTVRTSFVPTTRGDTIVDCTVTACAVLVAQVTNLGFRGAAAPISFAKVCTKPARRGHGFGDRNHCHTFAPPGLAGLRTRR